ncbi:short chain dehydrogenase [Polychaeton citri CBS 116435]|uniref:Short chain dehydrogenase n=1 Tax=Polychaeton citri CBS 116435 TaxID=1314669 RepID=A0A9P4PZZ7_9PEZI|nr:short chain dehydrogenase [Polychaeton citri CBS 116435]
MRHPIPRNMANTQPVALVVGGSRGIGRQVAIDLANSGYIVAVAAKSTSDAYDPKVQFPPDGNSPQSTISTVVREIRENGKQASAIKVDVRHYESVSGMLDEVVKLYGRIDAIIYNSGAIWWSSVEDTPFKRFQLMQQVNIEGLYATIQAALPHFAGNDWKGRIVVVSPPIYSRFFRGKTAYAAGKIGMSVITKGLAMDWTREGKDDMAITSIWPAVAIESGATRDADREDLRKANIFSEAIMAMLRSPAPAVNGRLELDEDYLRSDHGVSDFTKYACIAGASPRRIMPANLPDLTVAEQDDEGQRRNSAQFRSSKL